MCVRRKYRQVYGNKNITLKHFIMIIIFRRSRRARKENCKSKVCIKTYGFNFA